MYFAGCGVNLRGAGCEMVSFIFGTANLSVRPLFCSRCHDSLTQNVFFTFCSVILRELTPEKRAVKFLFGDIDFSTSIHFISDIISSKSGRVFDSAIQVKSNHWALAS